MTNHWTVGYILLRPNKKALGNKYNFKFIYLWFFCSEWYRMGTFWGFFSGVFYFC